MSASQTFEASEAPFGKLAVSTADDAASTVVTWRTWGALGLLSIAWAFAFTDRQILNLMVEPMKRDFGITDAQAGFLLGPAFTFTYILVGLFAGWCADRYSRRNLLFFAGILWSIATFASAFAQSYNGLIVTRLMVGAAEAFLLPSGMSMVAEMFDRRRLPLATSIYLISPYVGGGLAMIIGGLVMGATAGMEPIRLSFGVMRNWQIALALVGVIGILPIIALRFIREPVRGSNAIAGEDIRSFGFIEGTRYMLKSWRFFVMFFLGTACISLMLNTLPAWVPSMFVRQYGLGTEEIGVAYGILVLVTGIVGGIAAPAINRLLAPRYPDSTMRLALSGPIVMAVFAAFLPFIDSPWLALACVAAITFGYCFPMPMAGVSLQIATPPRLRGLASAYYFVIVSVLAVGIGPITVPFVAQAIIGKPDSVAGALSIVTICSSMLAFLLLLVALRGFQNASNH